MPAHASHAPHADAGSHRTTNAIVIAIAAAMQIVVAVPFTAASGLVAPLWGFVLAWALWLAGAVALVALARRRPLLTPVVPVVNAALLWGLITIGEQVLGWTG